MKNPAELDKAALINALDHIMRMARRSTSRSRRLGTIETRAYEALNGVPHDARNYESPVRNDNARANLIDAGPDLLAALKASPHGFHAPIQGDPCICSQCVFVRLRDAAIAKAEGKS